MIVGSRSKLFSASVDSLLPFRVRKIGPERDAAAAPT